MTNAIAIDKNGSLTTPAQDFSSQQIDLIANMIGVKPGTTEFNTFINIAKTKRLDPLTRQIYCIRPRNGGMQIFASIDGLRVIAERTGNYGGQTEPYWCGSDGVWRDVWLGDGAPSAAKVGVWKRGYEHPTWGVATFKSYGAGKQGNWQSMPDVMLAKCAEALALRKAFPDDLSALYVREEFDTPDSPEPPVNAPTVQHSRPERASVQAEVVDAETGEIQPTKETAEQRKLALGNAIKELRASLGWDASKVRVEADHLSLSLNSVAGLMQMVEALQIWNDIKLLQGALGWTEQDVRDEAPKFGIALTSVKGLREIAERLDGYVAADDEYEDDEPAQGTLIDAETRPIDRWAD